MICLHRPGRLCGSWYINGYIKHPSGNPPKGERERGRKGGGKEEGGREGGRGVGVSEGGEAKVHVLKL